MYGQLITRTVLTTVFHPWVFVYCCPHSTANALGTSNDVTVKSDLFGLRVAEGSLSKRARRNTAPVRVNGISQTIGCSNQNPSPDRYQESVSDDRGGQTAEMGLFQCWRDPSWLRTYQLRVAEKNRAERDNVSYFANLTDGVFRTACMGFVLGGLGCMHNLYAKVDRIAQEQAQTASAHVNAKLSIGRVVRCNPITGVRVKNVVVSRASNKHTTPHGKASYVHASVSGYVGLFLRKRPLVVNITVSRGALVISDLAATEYGGQRVKALNLEEPVQLLARGWQSFSTLRRAPFSRLLQPGAISLNRSQLRIECVQEGLTGRSVHSVDVVNMSSRFYFCGQSPEISIGLTEAEPRQTVLVANGSFLGGGHARVQVNVAQQANVSSKAFFSSVNASLKCSKVNIGSIACLFSLPFKLKDGTCTGNVELQLSPTTSYAPSISGQADVKSLGLRFDPNPESPELRNLTGKLRFRPSGVILDCVEGELGSIPLEAKGLIDFDEGFNIESRARPFDVNKVIETFALNRFIPLEGSVIGKAVVRGDIYQPCMSGWIKSTGSRAIADRMLLKSALMTYDWDAAAGNLLFPSIQATVVGGGELAGSGGIYFDMTQEKRHGDWSEKHHARNPKAMYWNSDENINRTLPPLPTDDFEIDKWAPFRPYDSMDFEINGSNLSGGNLIRWYGQKFGSTAVDAVGQIDGFCRISGHTEDANSRLVWRAVRKDSSRKSTGKLPVIPPASYFRRVQAESDLKHLNLNFGRYHEPSEAPEVEPHGAPRSTIVSWYDTSCEEDGAEFLGGLVYMKLGDLPEARRIKARTTLKGFHVKRLFSADPRFRHILLKTPNVIASMDTLFKGTVCMRPSWADNQAERVTRNIHLDLVSVDGGLAIRSLSLNSLTFRTIISGSLSLSATDVSLTLSECNLQNASPGLFEGDYKRGGVPPERAFEKLEVRLNTKGFFHIYSKWDDSELRASMSLSQNKNRILRLQLKTVDLQQLAGRYNPVLGDQHIEGIVTASIEIDWTRQEGHMQLSVADLALGPIHFEHMSGQLSLKDEEILLHEAVLKHGLSEYGLEGKCFVHDNTSDFEWFINVNVDRAYIGDISHLLDSGTKMLRYDSENLCYPNYGAENGLERASSISQTGSLCLQRGSPITYWEVPGELLFSEQAKWFNQSKATDIDAGIGALFDFGKCHRHEAHSALHSRNSLSGGITIYHPPRKSREKRKRANRNSNGGRTAALRNITCSFDLVGRDWTFHKTKLECINVSGLLEDGSLSIHPFRIKGEDGLLFEGQGSFTNNGSLDGHVSLHNTSASMFDIFQREGLETKGLVDASLRVKGNASNPSFYGQVLWRNATINGKLVSHPHADMVCANGRCIINLDAVMTGEQSPNQMRSIDCNKVSSAGALQHTTNSSKGTEKDDTVTDEVSSRKQHMDSVTAKVSLPTRLLIRQWVLPSLPKSFPLEGLKLPAHQHSFDDDWVFASVRIRRYGMMLLNGLIPDIGWLGGDSDVTFQLSGTNNNPALKGSIRVKNGHMHPSWMVQPIRSLEGEVELQDSGLMLCKAVSGRCNGRAISIRGGMFLSQRHLEPLEEKLRELQERVKSLDDNEEKTRREFQASLDEVESAVRAGHRGIRVEVGGIPIQISSESKGTVAGKLLLTGTVLQPYVRGSLVFLDGIISVNSALADIKERITTSVQPTADQLAISPHKEPRRSFRKEQDRNSAHISCGSVERQNDSYEPFCVHMEKCVCKRKYLNLWKYEESESVREDTYRERSCKCSPYKVDCSEV